VLAADENVDVALLPIAECLFLELQDCGCLSTTYGGAPGDLRRYAVERAKPAVRLFQVLESVGGLRFSDEQAVPHGYALGRWPDEIPIGGYADADGTRPSLVVTSMVDDWDTVASDMSTYLRLLRATLNVAYREGVDRGLRFLVDLHVAGHAIQVDTVRRVFQEILIARAQTGTDTQAVELLLGGPAPSGPSGWQDTLRSLPDLPGEYRLPDLPPSCRATVNAVLTSTLAEIDLVRQSRSYDVWLVGFGKLRGLLFLIRRLIADGGGGDAIAMKSILSRLEEIEMDCGAHLDSLALFTHAGAEHITTRNDFDYAREQLAPKYREAFGDDWAERLSQDRLVVPEILGPGMLMTPDPALPEEWRGVSWRLAAPFAWRFGMVSPTVLYRTDPFGIEAMLATVDLEGYFERWPVMIAEDRELMVRDAYRPDLLSLDAPDDARANDLSEAVRFAHLRLATEELESLTASVDEMIPDGRIDMA
jgi:hypothetical protein